MMEGFFAMEVHHVHKSPVDETVLVLGVFMYVNPELTLASCATASVDCNRAKFFDDILTLGKGSHAAALAAVQSSPAHHGPSVTVSSSVVPNDPYNGFIPPMPQYFYHYMGSFTTPPCTTGVTWILNPTPVAIFQASLTAYRNLIDALQGNQLAVLPQGSTILFTAPISDGQVAWDYNMGNNNRAVQPMGDRELFKVTLPMPSTSTTTTAEGPYDSSASSGSGGDYSASSMSSSASGESDPFGSGGSFGSTTFGSSGFYMATWKWITASILMCCCLISLCMLSHSNETKKKPEPKKKKKNVPAPASARDVPLTAKSKHNDHHDVSHSDSDEPDHHGHPADKKSKSKSASKKGDGKDKAKKRLKELKGHNSHDSHGEHDDPDHEDEGQPFLPMPGLMLAPPQLAASFTPPYVSYPSYQMPAMTDYSMPMELSMPTTTTFPATTPNYYYGGYSANYPGSVV